MPPTAQAGGAGNDDEDEELNPPLEEEAEESEDSDQVDYSEFSAEELLNRVHEYKRAYRAVRHQRNDAAVEVVGFHDEYGDLVHARDMQDEHVQLAQEEQDSIKCQTEAYRVRTELAMNEELVVHQSKILEFNEQSKQFAAHKKQFEEDEAQRLLHEVEWKQKARQSTQ